MPDPEIRSVTFFFDPSCPWTWRTSRWLVDAARARGVPVHYRPFELTNGAPLDELPAERRPAATASRSFLRAVHAAHDAGRDDLVDRWYTAYGTAVWDRHEPPSLVLVRTTLTEAGGDDLLGALDDAGHDGAVAASRAEAQQWSGEDTGSPVTLWEWDGGRRGFFGPVVAPQPTGADADQLWRTVVDAAQVPELFELKARRTASPTTA